MSLLPCSIERHRQYRDVEIHRGWSQSLCFAVFTETENICRRYSSDIQVCSCTEEYEKLLMHLLVSKRRFLAFRFAFLFCNVLEPFSHGEHPQSFTTDALKHVGQKLPCADFC